ncbi:MAG: thiamine phosphate synthase [Thermoplasmata archaeon]
MKPHHRHEVAHVRRLPAGHRRHNIRFCVLRGHDSHGRVVTRNFEELKKIAEISPIPVVVGSGVELQDLPELAKTGVDGFFVVSAITETDDPREEAIKLVGSWKACT